METQQTRRQIIRMHEGLASMGKRFLPTITSDIRVARMLQIVEPVATPLSAARSKIAAAVFEEAGVSEGEKVNGLLAQSLMAKIVERQHAFDLELETINLPDKKLTQADLPKERTGDDGWKNGAALGEIVADLGILFEMPKDE